MVALYGSKHKCARADTVFFPLSEVSARAMTLLQIHMCLHVNRDKFVLQYLHMCIETSL